jgi:hypothetical protein
LIFLLDFAVRIRERLSESRFTATYVGYQLLVTAREMVGKTASLVWKPEQALAEAVTSREPLIS